MEKKLIGIDLGGTTAKIGIISFSGKIEHQWEVATDSTDSGAHILPNLAQSIETKLAELELTKEDIHAVGIGVPGPVQKQTGYLPVAVNLGGFGGFSVSDKLEELLGIPAIVDNDANVAALGEVWMGGGNGTSDAVFVTLGTGVGGGIIVNGQVVSGFNGAGGEIGHIPVVKTGEHMYKCNCGQVGCVETVASATGFARVANTILANSKEASTLREVKKISAKSVLDHAKKGDQLALEAVDYSCRVLGETFGMISATTNPHIFIIGGGVSRAGQFLIDQIKKYYYGSVFEPATRGVEIVLAELGNDAGMLGAANLARNMATHE